MIMQSYDCRADVRQSRLTGVEQPDYLIQAAERRQTEDTTAAMLLIAPGGSLSVLCCDVRYSFMNSTLIGQDSTSYQQ